MLRWIYIWLLLDSSNNDKVVETVVEEPNPILGIIFILILVGFIAFKVFLGDE